VWAVALFGHTLGAAAIGPYRGGFPEGLTCHGAVSAGCCIGSPIEDRQYTRAASFGTPWVSNQIPTMIGTSGALFVIIYGDLLVAGNPLRGTSEVVQYGAASNRANSGHLLSFSVLQLDRPNRLVMLEVWDTMADYNAWEDANATTTNFDTQITPLLGSPLDYRLNDLCGSTYIGGTGCVPPWTAADGHGQRFGSGPLFEESLRCSPGTASPYPRAFSAAGLHGRPWRRH
jgi:hypothetical protein